MSDNHLPCHRAIRSPKIHSETCQHRVITIWNHASQNKSCKLFAYFQPTLLDLRPKVAELFTHHFSPSNLQATQLLHAISAIIPHERSEQYNVRRCNAHTGRQSLEILVPIEHNTGMGTSIICSWQTGWDLNQYQRPVCSQHHNH